MWPRVTEKEDERTRESAKEGHNETKKDTRRSRRTQGDQEGYRETKKGRAEAGTHLHGRTDLDASERVRPRRDHVPFLVDADADTAVVQHPCVEAQPALIPSRQE